MATITLSNSIGQPTTEIQAQTHKSHIAPVTIAADGSIINPNLPKAVEAPVEQVLKTPVKQQAPPQKSTQQMQEEERFAAIIRREKAMRAKVREYEEREIKTRTQYEADLAAAKAQAAEASEAKQWQERLKTDLIGTLSDAGYTTDQITEALMNQPGPESQLIRTLSAKIAKMEQAQQEQFKKQQEEATANYQNALKTIESNVNKLVRQNPDQFEVLAANEAQKSVVSYIEKVWKEEGVMLDPEEAATEIEDYLTEKSLGVSKLKKIQAKLAPKQPKAPAAPIAKGPSPTLTNKVAQSTRPLTARERAIAAFNANKVK
jgi:hypothetical protein